MSDLEWKFMCGKCKMCIGPSDTNKIRWGLCGFCREILTPREVNKWVEYIIRDYGVCY